MSRVEEVRAAADIVRVAGDYVKLRKSGVNLKGLCPFHQEKTPSFTVHPIKQIFHCFGCGVGGDVFKFVMLIENLSFPEALRRVAEKVGIVLGDTLDEETYDAIARERSALYKVHELAAKFYAAQLGATAEGRAARAYLSDRGLTDEIVGRFRLGYAPSHGQALTRHLADAGFKLELLEEKSGLVRHDAEGKRTVDRFRRRIIFPIANEVGKVVAFGARALGDDQPKYLNSPETAVYTKGRLLYHLDRAAHTIRSQDYAILVEGYMDCIAVASSGVENVVASCGTSLTERQTRLLGRSSRRVVVNFDPDSAGLAAIERSLALLLEAGFEVKVLVLPGGFDPDSFIRRHGATAYREALSGAPAYLDYLTDRAALKCDISRPEGKVAAANLVLPYLVKVPNPMLRAELGSRLAQRLRLEDRLVLNELRRAASEGRPELNEDSSIEKINQGVKLLLRACLEDEALAGELVPQVVESGACEGLVGEGAFKAILEFRRRGEKVDMSRLEESLSGEEARLIYDCLFLEVRMSSREYASDCLAALKQLKAERERKKLRAGIEDAIRNKDRRKLAELQEADQKLARQVPGIFRPSS